MVSGKEAARRRRQHRQQRQADEPEHDGDMVVDFSRAMKMASPDDRIVINHNGKVEGPRVLLLDVEKQQWVPIFMEQGQYLIRRTRPEDANPGKSRLILPPGYEQKQ